MEWFIILLGCIGLTDILMYGKILSKPRNYLIKYSFFKNLLSCAVCTGFWSGLFFSLILLITPINWYYIIFLPFASSAGSYFYNRLLNVLGEE